MTESFSELVAFNRRNKLRTTRALVDDPNPYKRQARLSKALALAFVLDKERARMDPIPPLEDVIEAIRGNPVGGLWGTLLRVAALEYAGVAGASAETWDLVVDLLAERL